VIPRGSDSAAKSAARPDRIDRSFREELECSEIGQRPEAVQRIKPAPSEKANEAIDRQRRIAERPMHVEKRHRFSAGSGSGTASSVRGADW
jgi:hypothetical protein